MYSLRNFEVENVLEFYRNITKTLWLSHALMFEYPLFQEKPVKIFPCFYHSEIREKHVSGEFSAPLGTKVIRLLQKSKIVWKRSLIQFLILSDNVNYFPQYSDLHSLKQTNQNKQTNKQTNKQKTLHFAFSSGTYLTSQWRQTAQCTWSSDWSQWVLVWYHLLHIFIWLQFITLHHKIENSKSLLIYKVITGILQCISCVYILSKYFRILTTVPELISSDMM